MTPPHTPVAWQNHWPSLAAAAAVVAVVVVARHIVDNWHVALAPTTVAVVRCDGHGSARQHTRNSAVSSWSPQTAPTPE